VSSTSQSPTAKARSHGLRRNTVTSLRRPRDRQPERHDKEYNRAVIRPGDWVILTTLPPWVSTLPVESQRVFAFCVGRRYRVDEIDEYGQLVLDVSADIDTRFGGYMNDIGVEPEYVAVTEPPSGSSA
jgi:hypothetical protein